MIDYRLIPDDNYYKEDKGVEGGNLDHNDKDDEEDKVSVQVGVAVPLLLLVETHLTKEKVLRNFLLLRCPDQREFLRSFLFLKRHLDAMVEFSNTVADVLLLLCKGFVHLLNKGKILNFSFAEQIFTNQ